MTIKELIREATEIIRNAKAAVKRGEITQEQAEEVIRNTLLDAAYQTEILPQEPIAGA